MIMNDWTKEIKPPGKFYAHKMDSADEPFLFDEESLNIPVVNIRKYGNGFQILLNETCKIGFCEAKKQGYFF